MTIEYQASTSIVEAVALLAANGGRARAFSSEGDLLVWIDRGLLDFDLLVDVRGIAELRAVVFDPGDGLMIGAGVPWCRLGEDPLVNAHYPCLGMVARLIESLPVEGLATLGSNVCSEPVKSDAIPALIVMGATCHIAGPAGRRALPMEGLWTEPGQTALEQGEMLVAIHLPAPRPRSGTWYIPFYANGEVELTYVRAAASLALNEEGSRILAVRVALGAAAPIPLLLDTIGAVLVGQAPSDAVLDTAAALARVATWPCRQAARDAVERMEAAGRLTRRTLDGALMQARKETERYSQRKGIRLTA